MTDNRKVSDITVAELLALLGNKPAPTTLGEAYHFRAEVLRLWKGREQGDHMNALLDSLPSRILYQPLGSDVLTVEEIRVLDFNQALYSIWTQGTAAHETQLVAGLYDLWPAHSPDGGMISGLMLVLDPNVIDGKPDSYHPSSVDRRARQWCRKKAWAAMNLDHGKEPKFQ